MRTPKGIDEAIHVHDKLVLILSQEALDSGCVQYEVEIASHKEREHKSLVLFPLRIDNAILTCTEGWARTLRARHIGDFTHWKQHDDYQQAFTRLLRDLKAEGQKQIDDEAAKDSHE